MVVGVELKALDAGRQARVLPPLRLFQVLGEDLQTELVGVTFTSSGGYQALCKENTVGVSTWLTRTLYWLSKVRSNAFGPRHILRFFYSSNFKKVIKG